MSPGPAPGLPSRDGDAKTDGAGRTLRGEKLLEGPCTTLMVSPSRGESGCGLGDEGDVLGMVSLCLRGVVVEVEVDVEVEVELEVVAVNVVVVVVVRAVAASRYCWSGGMQLAASAESFSQKEVPLIMSMTLRTAAGTENRCVNVHT